MGLTKTSVAAIVALERNTVRPWSDVEVSSTFSGNSKTIGIVDRFDHSLRGYALYSDSPHRRHVWIRRLVVAVDSRRLKFGTSLVEWLKNTYPKFTISATVADDLLDAHVFLRSLGFKVEKIEHNHQAPRPFAPSGVGGTTKSRRKFDSPRDHYIFTFGDRSSRNQST